MEEYEGWFICDDEGGCGWMGDVVWIAIPVGDSGMTKDRAACPVCRKAMIITTETTTKEESIHVA